LPTFWEQVTFFYELAIQIVNICIALRKRNGGFLEESECLSLLKATRGSQAQEVGSEDVKRAVDSLNQLGNDFKIITTGNKRVICSVAVELNNSHMDLLKFAE
jgi:ESCRT-II complex subunit VPS22